MTDKSAAGVLVTGGGGQLGRAFRRALPDAIVLSRTELDITDREAVKNVITKTRPELVINAAAFTKVDAAEVQPEEAMRINADGPGHLAEAAESVGAQLVQVSTDYVFSGSGAEPWRETDGTDPQSVYGKTKLKGEQAAQVCSRLMIVRTSWVFGEGHNFIRSILSAAWNGRTELSVVDDQKGSPTFAPHLAEGIMALAAQGVSGIFHLAGSGTGVTWAGLAEYAIARAELGTKVRRISTSEYAASHTGSLAPRPANSVLDCSKAAALNVVLPFWTEAVELYVTSIRSDQGLLRGPADSHHSRC